LVVAGYLGSLGPMRSAIVSALLLLLGACAAVTSAHPPVVEILPTNYVVQSVTLKTPVELKTYLAEHGIREVRLSFSRDLEYARLTETLIAVRDAGVSIGIVGSMKD